MEQGTDVTKLYTSEEVIIEDIEYLGEMWRFEFKEISFTNKKRVQSEMMVVKQNKKGESIATPDLEKLFVRMFQLTNTKAPAGFDITQVSEDFGKLIEKAIPGYGDDGEASEQDQKN